MSYLDEFIFKCNSINSYKTSFKKSYYNLPLKPQKGKSTPETDLQVTKDLKVLTILKLINSFLPQIYRLHVCLHLLDNHFCVKYMKQMKYFKADELNFSNRINKGVLNITSNYGVLLHSPPRSILGNTALQIGNCNFLK